MTICMYIMYIYIGYLKMANYMHIYNNITSELIQDLFPYRFKIYLY